MRPADRTAVVRERIARAAEECFERHGVAKASVETIAAVAGISRATVYRHFAGGKDEIVREVVVHEVALFLDELENRLPEQSSVTDALVDAMLAAVAYVHRRPRLALLFTPEFAGRTGSITGADTALTDLVIGHVRPHFARARAAGVVRPEVEVADAVELVLRMVFSLITVPRPAARTDAETRRFLRTCVAAALVTDADRATP